MQSATRANRKPTPQPTTISHQPCERGQHARGEIGNTGRTFIAEGGDIDRLRGRHPGHEQRQQQNAKSEHGAERGRTQHIERGQRRGGSLAVLAAAAQLVETEGCERAEQRKSGRERKQQRQHGVAEHRARQHQSEHGIDHAEDDGVARNSLEVFPAELQRPMQVGEADGSDHWRSRGILSALRQRCDTALNWSALIWSGHGRRLPLAAAFRALLGRKRAVSKNEHDQARRADRSVKLAMSRTECAAYSQSGADALTLR